MNKFDYGDVVKVKSDAPDEFHSGAKAWIVGVFNKKLGPYFDKFPMGVVYTIEYEDGSSIEIHENYLMECSGNNSGGLG